MQACAINPFLAAAVNVYRESFTIEATPGEPYILKDQINHRWEISGVLGVTGAHQGVIAFRLPRLLAEKMLVKSGVATADEAERKEMVIGMVGELTNIIAGNASDEFDALDISPPIVVVGANHEISWPRIAPVIGIPFSTTHGPFEVDVCIK